MDFLTNLDANAMLISLVILAAALYVAVLFWVLGQSQAGRHADDQGRQAA